MLSACLLLVFIKNCTIFIYLSFDSRSQFPRRGGEENRTKRKSEPFLIERKLSIPFRFSLPQFSLPIDTTARKHQRQPRSLRNRSGESCSREIFDSIHDSFHFFFSLFFLNRAEEAPLPPASRPQEDLPSQEPGRG